MDMEQVHHQPDQSKQASKVAKSNEANWGLVFGLVGQIGYIIAIPAVLFAFGGAYLDKYAGTSPLFVILGLSIAFLASAFGVARVIKTITALDKK
ncbi:AtpZ/AtpI family protein [Candidatus Peregrinibacteria bacterium]|nr:AtpZ/AtpI family protein [Candidatus Peregrinibacteria bacterium]